MDIDLDPRSSHRMPAHAILEPGRNCWRRARAGRVAVIGDAAAYFAAAKAAILQARHTVFLIGWDFDWRIRLERDDDDPTVPDELGAFLTHVVEARPEVRIFVLRWDLSFLNVPFRATVPLKILDWLSGKRLDLRADHEHPLGGCHHQKIVVIDDCLAFCGGIDMTLHRWDTPEHADADPRRVDRGSAYGPWHDVTTCLDGDAARSLGELARARWLRATGETVPEAPAAQALWPPGVTPDFTDVEVAIARTEPAYGGYPEVREIEALYLDAIAAARHAIYLESQYFASTRIAAALARRLAEPDGPSVVVVNPESAVGWLEEEVMGSARAILLEEMGRADEHGRFRLYTPVTPGGADIYVHAKVLIVDDRLLRVGSSNVNNRSLGLDTECDLAIEARGPGEAASIRAIRDRLLAEHLGVAAHEVEQALETTGGSLVRAVEALRRPDGRTLVPFVAPELTSVEAAVAESGLLDPDRAEALAPHSPRGRLPSRTGLAATLAGLSLIAASSFMLVRRRGSRRRSTLRS